MTFWLNFHGIGEAPRAYESREQPYWITADHFSAIIDLVEASEQSVGITFDDGNDSDYYIAAPALRARGRQAIFFVLAGKLDQTGYLTKSQVRELDNDELFTIGSHGMMHRPWPDCDDAELEQEIGEAREILSEICGRPITQTGLPFGRYNRAVLKRLKAQGSKVIFSSDGGPRLTRGLPVPRFSVRRDTNMDELASMIANSAHLISRARNELRAQIKSFI